MACLWMLLVATAIQGIHLCDVSSGLNSTTINPAPVETTMSGSVCLLCVTAHSTAPVTRIVSAMLREYVEVCHGAPEVLNRSTLITFALYVRPPPAG